MKKKIEKGSREKATKRYWLQIDSSGYNEMTFESKEEAIEECCPGDRVLEVVVMKEYRIEKQPNRLVEVIK